MRNRANELSCVLLILSGADLPPLYLDSPGRTAALQWCHSHNSLPVMSGACLLNRWKHRFKLVLLPGFVPSFFHLHSYVVQLRALSMEHSLFVVIHFLCFILVFSLKFAGKTYWEDKYGVQLK